MRAVESHSFRRFSLRSHDRARLLTDLCATEPRWTSDSRRIIVCALERRILAVEPERPNSPDTLAEVRAYPSSVTPDGRRLLLEEPNYGGKAVSNTVYLLDLGSRGTPRTLSLSGKGNIWLPALSPDGRWLAYLATGGLGVLAEPVPPTGEVIRVSGPLDGDVPAWGRTGDEMVFLSSSRLYVVGVHPGTPPRFDPPRLVSPIRVANLDGRPYAPFADGQRFVVKMPSAEHSAGSIHLVIGGGAAETR